MIIENQQQYHITKDWIAKFEESLKAVLAKPDKDPLFQQVLRDSVESEIEALCGQIAAYEARRGAPAPSLPLSDGAGL